MLTSEGVTFFTSIKNRLHHLSRTLPENIRQNNMETTSFLIADFGSQDGLAQWLNTNLKEDIATDKIMLFSFPDEPFHRSRSKNIAAALCKEGIICNLDADNFAGPELDKYLTEKIGSNRTKVMTGLGNPWNSRDVCGKVALRKELFDAVGGYNEQFAGYGFEDYDLYYRLEDHKAEIECFDSERFLEYIPHSDLERICNNEYFYKVDSIFTYQADTGLMALLFLFSDMTFQYGVVKSVSIDIDNSGVETKGGKIKEQLIGNRFESGQWATDHNIVRLRFSSFATTLNWERDKTLLVNASHRFEKINSRDLQIEALLRRDLLANRSKLFALNENFCENQ